MWRQSKKLLNIATVQNYVEYEDSTTNFIAYEDSTRDYIAMNTVQEIR